MAFRTQVEGFLSSIDPSASEYNSRFLLPIADYSNPIRLQKLRQATRQLIPGEIRALKLQAGRLLDQKELSWVMATDGWQETTESTQNLLSAMPPGVVSPNANRVAIWKRLERAFQRVPVKVAAYDSRAFFIIQGTKDYLVTIDFKRKLIASSCPEYNSENANTRRRFELCFMPGTFVETPTGPRAIEDMLVGDQVVGQTGIQTITHTFRRQYDGEVVFLKAYYCDDVTATIEHPILTTRVRRVWDSVKIAEPVWLSAGDISTSDYVMVPKDAVQPKKTTIDFGSYYQTAKRRNRFFDEPLQVDEDFAELLGIYLADGSISTTRAGQTHVEITLSKNETEIASRVIELAKSLGVSARTYPLKNEKAMRVTFGSAPLGRWLKESVGTTSLGKRIPESFFSAQPDIVSALLRGYTMGDGTVTRNGPYETTTLYTANHLLARQLHRLLLRTGIVAGLNHYPQRPHYYRTNLIAGGEIYDLSFPSTRKWPHFYQDDNFYYFKVYQTRRSQYKGPVHNLETTDSTYCVPFVVHNCKHSISALIYYRTELYSRSGLPKSEVDGWEKSFQSCQSLSHAIRANWYYYFLRNFLPALGLSAAYYKDSTSIGPAIQFMLGAKQ